jgi:hypothetical protein
VSGQLHSPAVLSPGEEDLVLIAYEVGRCGGETSLALLLTFNTSDINFEGLKLYVRTYMKYCDQNRYMFKKNSEIVKSYILLKDAHGDCFLPS